MHQWEAHLMLSSGWATNVKRVILGISHQNTAGTQTHPVANRHLLSHYRPNTEKIHISNFHFSG